MVGVNRLTQHENPEQFRHNPHNL